MRVKYFRAVTPQLTVSGHEYLFVTDVQAVVTSIDVIPDGDTELFWVFTATITYPGGTVVEGAQVLLPLVPETSKTEFNYVYRRSVKPAAGFTFAQPDGSQWIYPDDGSGTYECFYAGSGAAQGDIRTLAEISGTTASPAVIDPACDWLPVADGALIGVGDTVLYTTGRTYLISGKSSTYDAATKMTTWTFEAGAPDPVPVVTVVLPAAWPKIIGFGKDVYQVSAIPTVGSKWRGSDGSQWIYPSTTVDAFYCWKSGTVYQKRAVFPVGDLTITLFLVP